jgi:hypothetical protein
VRNELELIAERAGRIAEKAAGALELAAITDGADDEQLYDTARNVSGTLDMILDALSVWDGRTPELSRARLPGLSRGTTWPEKTCGSTADHGPHEWAYPDGEPCWCRGYGPSALPPWMTPGPAI